MCEALCGYELRFVLRLRVLESAFSIYPSLGVPSLRRYMAKILILMSGNALRARHGHAEGWERLEPVYLLAVAYCLGGIIEDNLAVESRDGGTSRARPGTCGAGAMPTS